MAVTSGPIQTTPYQAPDYSGSVAAARSLAMTKAQGVAEPFRQIADYTKQQKDLAQKDKEMAAKIKGTASLLDNAKALYPDFAEQIEATKLQLSDPSLSNLDKSAISDRVADSLNLITSQGMDKAKIRLMEAQASELSAGKAPKTELTTVVNPQTGQEIPVIVNFSTGEAIPVTPENMPATQMPVESQTTTAIQGTPQVGLGTPPMDIPIVGGQMVPANEGKLINNNTQVIWNKGIYDVDTGVLNSKDQAAETRGEAIKQASNLPSTPSFIAPGSQKKELELKKLALEISNLQSGDKTKDTELFRKKREADLEAVLRKNRTEKALEESGQAKTPEKLKQIEEATQELDSGKTQKAINRLNSQGITYMGMPISTQTIDFVLGTKESRAKEAEAIVEQAGAESLPELETTQSAKLSQSFSASQQEIFNAVKKANPNVSDEEIIKGLQSKPYFK